MVIAAKSGEGKSILGKHMGLCMGSGYPFLGFGVMARQRVLYCNFEIQERQLWERLGLIAKARPEIIPKSDEWFQQISTLTPVKIGHDEEHRQGVNGGIGYYNGLVQSLGSTVIILDTQFKIQTGSMSNEVDVRRFLDDIDWMRDQNPGLAVVIITHTNKNLFFQGRRIERGLDEVFGSSMLPNWAETVVGVTRGEFGSSTMRMLKRREEREEIKPIEYVVDAEHFSVREPGSQLIVSALPPLAPKKG